MALNPRMVATDIDVAYDGGITHVLRGTIIDCPPGSPMEAAYGADNLVDLNSQDETSIGAGAITVVADGGSG